MAVTSVIQIDVQDEKFKEFAKAFDKYKESLKSTTDDWGDAGESANKQMGVLEKHFKNIKKHQKDFVATLGDANQVLKSTVKSTAEIAKNFAAVGLSIAKWFTLGALGGGFGIGALASSAGNTRRQAQGLGVSTGDLRSTSVNFNRYIDAESTLSKVADIQNDLSRRQILSRLGGKEGQNPAEMLPALIQNALSEFKRGGQTQQYAEAVGLTQVFSVDELRRLAQLSEAELNQTIAKFERDRKALEVKDTDSRAMQEFWIQLRRAGEILETGFIKTVSVLTPELTKLSEVITNAIVSFATSNEVRESLRKFIEYLSSDDAKAKMRDFFDGLGKLAKIIIKVVGWFAGDVTSSTNQPDTPVGKTGKGGYTYKNGVIDNTNPNNYWGGKWFNYFNPNYQKALGMQQQQTKPVTNNAQQFLAELEKKRGLPQGLLDKVWSAESNRGKNMMSSAGAEGHFQFIPATAREYGLKDPYNFEESADAASRKIKDLLRKYENNLAHAMVAYNWGDGNVNRYIRGEKQLPNETRGYLDKLNINVNNAAGSDLIVSSNALR